MNVLYCRTSTLQQKTDRQRVNEKEYSLVIEDKCSGTIPFFERPGGKKVKQLLDNGSLSELAVWQIDRLGRDLRDILNTIHYFTEINIPIHFVTQSLRTIDKDGKENPISKLIISVLGVVGEMERNQIRERQLEGVAIAKAKGVYVGRQKGSREDVLKFLTKPRNSKALAYLKKGYSNTEAAKLSGVHINTVTKIKKVGLPSKQTA